MKRIAVSLFFLASFAMPALANDAHHPAVETAADAQAAQPLSEGQVRRIDKEAGKLTIRHGPLANLGMPAMTMVFRVREPAMLDQVKVDDAIRFTAEQVDGNLTVTRIENVR